MFGLSLLTFKLCKVLVKVLFHVELEHGPFNPQSEALPYKLFLDTLEM